VLRYRGHLEFRYLAPGTINLRLGVVQTQVKILAKVIVEGDRLAKSMTIRITHPNSCSLKYDDLDLKMRAMLADSGIEPIDPGESLQPESAEADVE
jgi:hypothetical protein